MSDDLGTVNLRRGERGREIEVLRQQYRRHREHLEKMTADAPTEHLASEYQRIVRAIDASLLKLDELEGRGQVPAAPPRPQVPLPAARPEGINPDTQPAMRPLQPHPALRHLEEDDADTPELQFEEEGGRRGMRTLLIVLVAVVALAVIGWLVWRSSSGESDAPLPVTETESVAPAEPDTATVEPRASALAVTPASHNYGLVRKGTRSTRQFEIANPTTEPMNVQVARSECRCLFYEYIDTIAPNSKEMLTVTVDGTRAKAGELRETIKVSAKGDPAKSATFDVVASVQ